MRRLTLFLISLLALAGAQAEPIFREDFKEVPAHIPVTSNDLTSDFLTLKRLGPGADQLKLSHHPEIPNDPHYIWNGECAGPVLVAFQFKKNLDLSGGQEAVRLRTKNSGPSTLHLALRSGKNWWVQKEHVANAEDWNVQTITLHGKTWHQLNPQSIKIDPKATQVDFSKIDALGFVAPRKPNRSKDSIRLDWFELIKTSKTPASSLPSGEFLENKTPFLRSALTFKSGKNTNRIRRGVILPLGHQHWACFDPDLLRWAAIWKSPQDKAPLTYDSMASVSFPRKQAKADRPPQLVGTILYQTPELPGGATGSMPTTDPRQTTLSDGKSPVGPLPAQQGRWIGISLRGDTPVIHYQLGDTIISETITATHSGAVERLLEISPSASALTLRLGSSDFKAYGMGARINDQTLHLEPAQSSRIIFLTTSTSTPTQKPSFPPPSAANPIFPKASHLTHPATTKDGPFSVRNLPLPENDRPVRPTDIAFLSDGTALLSTLDGDIWRIENIEGPQSTWQRVATGLFEPMGIETTPDDKIFVLGRDQITELIDINADGHIDIFRNASDAFLQTLHTRDFAMSFALAADGSFLVAKGGMERGSPEMSAHRGAILKINPSDQSVTVLADGLRIPYVGARADGAIFASDQQGHHIPSTPIHLLEASHPFLGFPATNHQKAKKVTEPLFYYPHQINRSAAGFVQLAEKSFPDLANRFLQISWNGRLFGIATPDQGLPFSWQLPVQFDFPTLNGATHPKSGQLYLTGLGISGYKPTTPREWGLASLSQNHPLPTPKTLEVTENTVTVTFQRPLSNTETIIPGNPALRLFNVARTNKYGSGHFKWDGQPGEHQFQANSFNLSADRRSLTLNFAMLKKSDLFDLSLNVSSRSVTTPLHLFTRPSHLPAANDHDLATLKKQTTQAPLVPGDPAKGKPIFTQYACIGCHSLNGENLTGPSLNGIGSRHDKAFLRESILEPAAKITEGYEASMPSFKGVIPPQDLEHLIAYLKSLR